MPEVEYLDDRSNDYSTQGGRLTPLNEIAKNKSMLLVSSRESVMMRDAVTKHNKSTDRSLLVNKISAESEHSPSGIIYSPCFFEENNPDQNRSSSKQLSKT